MGVDLIGHVQLGYWLHHVVLVQLQHSVRPDQQLAEVGAGDTSPKRVPQRQELGRFRQQRAGTELGLGPRGVEHHRQQLVHRRDGVQVLRLGVDSVQQAAPRGHFPRHHELVKVVEGDVVEEVHVPEEAVAQSQAPPSVPHVVGGGQVPGQHPRHTSLLVKRQHPGDLPRHPERVEGEVRGAQ